MSRRPDPNRFVTVPEVARMLRVSNMTVYRLVNAEELPAFRIGRSIRIPLTAVGRFLEQHRVTDSWEASQAEDTEDTDAQVTPLPRTASQAS